MTEDEQVRYDHEWYCFRRLYFYLSCLYDEEAITSKTYETMNDALEGLKPELEE